MSPKPVKGHFKIPDSRRQVQVYRVNPQEKVQVMTQVVLGQNEGIESALRRFKRQVSKAGILADVKRYRHFETPLEKKKRKGIAARRKRRFQ
jgi:small subunit ribosomal protein S21